MLVVKVELWPHGQGGTNVSTIATMVIANMGGTMTLGDYSAVIAADGSQPSDPHALFARFDRRAEIKGHPRLARPVWNLVSKALASLGFANDD
jgi:hypothetical protein